jgi:hypothetical protein
MMAEAGCGDPVTPVRTVVPPNPFCGSGFNGLEGVAEQNAMVAGTYQLRIWTTGGLLPAAVLVALLVTGCVPPDMGRPQPSTTAPVPATAPPPAVAVIRPVPDLGEAPPAPAEPLPAPRTAPPVSSASQALLTQSRGHQAAGRYEQAAASIERPHQNEPRQSPVLAELRQHPAEGRRLRPGGEHGGARR